MLLGACKTGSHEAECDEASVFDHFRFDPYSSELSPPLHGVRTPGHFSAWGEGEVIFQRKGGEPHGFFLLMDHQAMIPDVLASSQPPRPGITAYGFDPPVASPAAPLLRFGGDPGNLRLLAGNVELLDEIDGWTVRSPRDETTCEGFEGDSSWVRVKPVYVSHDGEEVRLFAGQRAVFGDYEVSIVSAQSNNRNHPWAPCSDRDCPWEKLSWWIAPLVADLIAATSREPRMPVN